MRYWLVLAYITIPVAFAFTPTNPGDLNNDSRVDILDIAIIQGQLGLSPLTDPRADPNNDNAANIFDIIAVARSWGASYSSGPQCGNGVVEGTEQCDGSNLNGATCTSRGFTGGTISCTAGCTLDTSQCVNATSAVQAYSTYLSGNSEDVARDIYVDNQGYVYVSGGTKSTNFKTTPGAYDRTHNGNMDMFVMKLAPNGTVLFSTFIGGSGYDRAYGLEVDSQGYVYLSGRGGPGFPTTAGVVQPVFGGDVIGSTAYGQEDGALVKLSPDGSQVIWATYIGSDDGGYFRDIDVDGSGTVYAVMAQVERPGHIITPGALQSTLPGIEDMYIVKLAPDAKSIRYATYLGGSAIDGYGPTIRALDNGEMYISSGVFSTDIPVSTGAYDQTQNGNQDFYIARLSADLSTVLAATFYGGSALEFSETHSIWVQDDSTILVASGTASSDLPLTAGAYDTTYNGGVTDAYVARFSADLSTLLYATLIGGSGVERVEGFSAGANGDIYVGGTTASSNFPTTANGADRTYGGGSSDAWIGRFSPDLASLTYASFIGGSGLEEGRSQFGTAQAIYSVGQTDSTNFPTTPNAWGSAAGGVKDGYIVITPLP